MECLEQQSLQAKNFIRFIQMQVRIYNWVDDGKWSYIPDKHTAVNKDWTGNWKNGDQWLSDRNRSAKPRFVCELQFQVTM